MERHRDIERERERERERQTDRHTHTHTDLDGGGVNVLVMRVSCCSRSSMLRSFCDIKKQGTAQCREDIKRGERQRQRDLEGGRG